MSRVQRLSAIGARVSGAVESLDAQLTPLVRYGLVGILAIIGGLGLINLRDAVESRRAETARLAGEVQTLDTLESEEVWAGRLEQARALRAQATSDLWRGTTQGIVTAQLEQTLRRLHAPFVPTGPRASARDATPLINIDTELDTRTDVARLGVRMSGRIGRHQADDFVTALAAATPPIYIDALTINLPMRDVEPASFSLDGSIRVGIEPAQAQP